MGRDAGGRGSEVQRGGNKKKNRAKVAHLLPKWICRMGLGRAVDEICMQEWGVLGKNSGCLHCPRVMWVRMGWELNACYLRMAANRCLAECEKLESCAPPWLHGEGQSCALKSIQEPGQGVQGHREPSCIPGHMQSLVLAEINGLSDQLLFKTFNDKPALGRELKELCTPLVLSMNEPEQNCKFACKQS